MHSAEEQIYAEIGNEHREECNDAISMEKLGMAEYFQAASHIEHQDNVLPSNSAIPFTAGRCKGWW